MQKEERNSIYDKWIDGINTITKNLKLDNLNYTIIIITYRSKESSRRARNRDEISLIIF